MRSVIYYNLLLYAGLLCLFVSLISKFPPTEVGGIDTEDYRISYWCSGRGVLVFRPLCACQCFACLPIPSFPSFFCGFLSWTRCDRDRSTVIHLTLIYGEFGKGGGRRGKKLSSSLFLCVGNFLVSCHIW